MAAQKKTYKVNSNSWDVRLGVSVVGKPKQKTRLSDPGISNKKQFEKVIAADWSEEDEEGRWMWVKRNGQRYVSRK